MSNPDSLRPIKPAAAAPPLKVPSALKPPPPPPGLHRPPSAAPAVPLFDHTVAAETEKRAALLRTLRGVFPFGFEERKAGKK